MTQSWVLLKKPVQPLRSICHKENFQQTQTWHR